jgi:hypothetical protein
MMFNGINFKFGSVDVSISSIDTEKATGYLDIKIPVKDFVMEISIKRWIGWSGNVEVNAHFDLHGPTKEQPEPDYDEDEDGEGDEDHEEESA